MKKNNEIIPTGFRIKSGMTGMESGRSTPSLSPSGLTGGSIMAEYGRSMVEMLGTLAIIGVLSIGGIAGYSYGMDKYHANETINDVNLRGIDLVTQVSMGRATLSLSDWPTVSKAGYSISEPVLSAEGDAYFSISGVPKRVCEMVYNGIMQNQTTDVEVNGYVVDDSSACGDDNKMGFFFITNAGEGGTTIDELCEDVSCDEGTSCVAGICMVNDVKQFASDYYKCESDTQCSICEYCRDGIYCDIVNDGTSCGEGLVCKYGDCIKDSTCTDNIDCSDGYYCGYTRKLLGNGDSESGSIYASKICIKAQVKVITISTGKNFYLSHKKLPYHEDAVSLCASINKTLITDYTNNPDIVQRIAELTPGDTYFYGQTEHLYAYPTQKIPNNDMRIINTISADAYALCVD